MQREIEKSQTKSYTILKIKIRLHVTVLKFELNWTPPMNNQKARIPGHFSPAVACSHA